MSKILVVEDESDINKLLCSILSNVGHHTRGAFSGTEALMCVQEEKWDLIMLDLMIPGLSGEELIIKVREITKAPIIIVSAKTALQTKLELLDKGADDFVCKPFDPEELLARVNSNLRRYLEFSIREEGDDNTLHFKDIILNTEVKEVKVSNKKINLTSREYSILELLLKNKNKIFSKGNIFETVWGEEYFGDDNTVNVHMSRLRTKLSEGNPKEEYIETVWAMGYKLKK